MNKKLNNINLHRFIYVLKLIYEKGDADNPISSTEIIEILNTEKNIDICQRTIDTIVKSFNEAIENDFEISILNSKPKKYYFHSTPSLEFGEAKAIIDLVYSSKFFTERIKNNFIDRMQEQFNNSKKIMLEKELILIYQVMKMIILSFHLLNKFQLLFITKTLFHFIIQKNYLIILVLV